MTDAETREIVIELSVPLVKARIAQHEIQESIQELLDTLPEEFHSWAAYTQYECFMEAIKRAKLDPAHPAFNKMHRLFGTAVEVELYEQAVMN